MNHARLKKLLLTLAAVVLPFSAFAQADDQQAPDQRAGDPYPLATCPVSGEALGSMGDPVIRVYDGREVRFCCDGCIDKFEAGAETYWQKIDQQIIEQQAGQYPLETCPVSGEKLGGMGEPHKLVHNNRLVQFCCEGCVKDFKADPEKFLKQMDAAVIEAQTADYPLETCVVSGEPLGAMGAPVDAVYANQLVRFCCADCQVGFEKSPAKYLEKIKAAREGKAPEAPAAGVAPTGHDHQKAGQNSMNCSAESCC